MCEGQRGRGAGKLIFPIHVSLKQTMGLSGYK